MKPLGTLLLTSMMCFPAIAQDLQVKGTVTSASDHLTLPGVSILVKGTQKGVVTDKDRFFEISVPDDVILVFSYVCMFQYMHTSGNYSGKCGGESN